MEKQEYSALADHDLLTLSLKEPAAFEVLVDRYQEPFMRKALKILRDQELAEDAVQDAFVKIYVGAKKFTPQAGASFSSWGYKVLINHCLTLYQKHKKYTGAYAKSEELDPEFAEHMTDHSQIELHEHMLSEDYLLSLISRLPLAFSRVLRMFAIEGKSYEEIAEKEGVSEVAIRTRVHRAKKELKKFHMMLT